MPLVKFRWNLAGLTSPVPEISKPFTVRTAGQEEVEEALRAVKSSYDLDPEWSGCDKYVEDTVLVGVKKALATGGECLLVQHGNRVIAASVYTPEPGDDGVHLVSGPCVLIEYRNRGLGGSLLGATLEALRARGLVEAYGRTRPNGPSAKFLASKFGGQPVNVPPTPAPAPPDAVAA
jgi:hypothetical protein